MSELGLTWEREDLGGGKWRHTQQIKPIAYLRDGSFRRISNLVGVTGDPNFPIGVDELMQVRVRESLRGNAPVVHIGHGQDHIRWTPLGTNNVDGQVLGNRILYPGAWNNADLALTVGGHLIRKEIMLRAGHPQVFEFRVDEKAGEWVIGDGGIGIGKIRLPQPYLERGAELAPLVWKTRQQGGKTILRVELPAGDWSGWTLDPTATLQPDATAGNDARIVSSAATNNYGTSTYGAVGDVGSADNAERALIKFDVSSIPSTATVNTATLSLYEWSAGDTASLGSWAVGLRRLLRNWVEAQVTWNIYSTGNNWTTAGAGSDSNDRAAGDSASVTMDGTAANAFVDWAHATLLDDVQKFVNGTYSNYGWLQQAPTAEYRGTTPIAGNAFYHSDYTTDTAKRPKLVVEYTEAAVGHPMMLRGTHVPGLRQWQPQRRF